MRDFLIFLGLVTPPIAIGFGVAWLMTRSELRRLRAERQPGQSAERFERIERAVESVAMDVERLAEDQRFTTRLLAERQTDRLPLRTGTERHTPH